MLFVPNRAFGFVHHFISADGVVFTLPLDMRLGFYFCKIKRPDLCIIYISQFFTILILVPYLNFIILTGIGICFSLIYGNLFTDIEYSGIF
jgi:hypothetical protein